MTLKDPLLAAASGQPQTQGEKNARHGAYAGATTTAEDASDAAANPKTETENEPDAQETKPTAASAPKPEADAKEAGPGVPESKAEPAAAPAPAPSPARTTPLEAASDADASPKTETEGAAEGGAKGVPEGEGKAKSPKPLVGAAAKRAYDDKNKARAAATAAAKASAHCRGGRGLFRGGRGRGRGRGHRIVGGYQRTKSEVLITCATRETAPFCGFLRKFGRVVAAMPAGYASAVAHAQQHQCPVYFVLKDRTQKLYGPYSIKGVPEAPIPELAARFPAQLVLRRMTSTKCVVLERGVSLQLGRGCLPADIAVAGRPPLRALSQNTPPRAKPAAVSYVRAATREDDEAHAALLRWAKKGMSAERAEIAARKKALSVDERHAERVARNLAARGA